MSPLGRSGKHYMNPKVMDAKGDSPEAVPPIPEEQNEQPEPEMVQCPSCGAEFPMPDTAEEQSEEEVAPGIHQAVAKDLSSKIKESY